MTVKKFVLPKQVGIGFLVLSILISIGLVTASVVIYSGSIKTVKVAKTKLVDTTQRYDTYLAVKAQVAAHEAAKQTIPMGYTDWNDSGIAWKWSTGGCSYYTRCSHIKIYAYEYCSSGVYVEANFTHNGTIVDYDNATVGSMAPGDTAKLKLESYNDNADRTQITQITCNK